MSVSSYFDFVRVRNLLTKEEVSFAVNSEYTEPREAARARTLFADGIARVASERAGSLLLSPPHQGCQRNLFLLSTGARALLSRTRLVPRRFRFHRVRIRARSATRAASSRSSQNWTRSSSSASWGARGAPR